MSVEGSFDILVFLLPKNILPWFVTTDIDKWEFPGRLVKWYIDKLTQPPMSDGI